MSEIHETVNTPLQDPECQKTNKRKKICSHLLKILSIFSFFISIINIIMSYYAVKFVSVNYITRFGFIIIFSTNIYFLVKNFICFLNTKNKEKNNYNYFDKLITIILHLMAWFVLFKAKSFNDTS